MVLTIPMVFTLTDGMVSVLLHDTCTRGSSVAYYNLFGPIWTHLDKFRALSTNLDAIGPIESHLEPLEPFGSILIYFKLFEAI